MKIGDIDVTNSIINLEYDVFILKQVLNQILRNNPNLDVPKNNEIEKFQNEAVEILNKKYPNMGIKKK